MTDIKSTGKSFTSENKYSILNLAGYHFGVEITQVKEVIPFPKITRIPNVHRCIIGVFNLRGQIFSIIDLRILLNLEVLPVTDKNFAVIIGYENSPFGICVDKIRDVIRIDESKIQIVSREMPARFISYVTGHYEDKKFGLVYLLDVKSIINAKEISQYRF